MTSTQGGHNSKVLWELVRHTDQSHTIPMAHRNCIRSRDGNPSYRVCLTRNRRWETVPHTRARKHATRGHCKHMRKSQPHFLSEVANSFYQNLPDHPAIDLFTSHLDQIITYACEDSSHLISGSCREASNWILGAAKSHFDAGKYVSCPPSNQMLPCKWVAERVHDDDNGGKLPLTMRCLSRELSLKLVWDFWEGCLMVFWWVGV